MSIIINATQDLPELPGNHERIISVKITSGTVSLQYKSGADYVTAKQYTADGVDRVYVKGFALRVLISGVATVEIGD